MPKETKQVIHNTLIYDEARGKLDRGAHKRLCPIDHSKTCDRLIDGRVCNKLEKDEIHASADGKRHHTFTKLKGFDR